MKKRTKRLIEDIQNAISDTYPFLDESEQKEIFENFVYRSLLNELNFPERNLTDLEPNQMKNVFKAVNALKNPKTQKQMMWGILNRYPQVTSNDLRSLILTGKVDPAKKGQVLTVLMNVGSKLR